MKIQCCKSKTKDKAQGGTSDSSADYKIKEFEFSDDPIKSVRSNEDFSFQWRQTESYS